MKAQRQQSPANLSPKDIADDPARTIKQLNDAYQSLFYDVVKLETRIDNLEQDLKAYKRS